MHALRLLKPAGASHNGAAAHNGDGGQPGEPSGSGRPAEESLTLAMDTSDYNLGIDFDDTFLMQRRKMPAAPLK